MRRREFIAKLGGAAATSAIWPLAARAQQPPLPVVGFIHLGSSDTSQRNLGAFRQGLSEAGCVEGRDVSVEYDWLEGQCDRIPALVADLVSRRVAVIATRANPVAATAAKAATAAIPIVFGVGDDQVGLGLVASLARPGGNATGMNFLSNEAISKRLGFLHELVPKATRVAVLVNPASIASTGQLGEVQDAARRMGLLVDVIKASTSREIEEAFAMLMRERIEALFITGDAYFGSRRVQFVTLAARRGIAACYSDRDFAAAGGLMSYGSDFADMFHQVGLYAGRILKGARPADLPVVQATKFEFVINRKTANSLGLEIPATLLAIADEVIE
jgi:putative tryptophan/tyrosine transport system substrate-binding protein